MKRSSDADHLTEADKPDVPARSPSAVKTASSNTPVAPAPCVGSQTIAAEEEKTTIDHSWDEGVAPGSVPCSVQGPSPCPKSKASSSTLSLSPVSGVVDVNADSVSFASPSKAKQVRDLTEGSRHGSTEGAAVMNDSAETETEFNSASRDGLLKIPVPCARSPSKADVAELFSDEEPRGPATPVHGGSAAGFASSSDTSIGTPTTLSSPFSQLSSGSQTQSDGPRLSIIGDESDLIQLIQSTRCLLDTNEVTEAEMCEEGKINTKAQLPLSAPHHLAGTATLESMGEGSTSSVSLSSRRPSIHQSLTERISRYCLTFLFQILTLITMATIRTGEFASAQLDTFVYPIIERMLEPRALATTSVVLVASGALIYFNPRTLIAMTVTSSGLAVGTLAGTLYVRRRGLRNVLPQWVLEVGQISLLDISQWSWTSGNITQLLNLFILPLSPNDMAAVIERLPPAWQRALLFRPIDLLQNSPQSVGASRLTGPRLELMQSVASGQDQPSGHSEPTPVSSGACASGWLDPQPDATLVDLARELAPMILASNEGGGGCLESKEPVSASTKAESKALSEESDDLEHNAVPPTVLIERCTQSFEKASARPRRENNDLPEESRNVPSRVVWNSALPFIVAAPDFFMRFMMRSISPRIYTALYNPQAISLAPRNMTLLQFGIDRARLVMGSPHRLAMALMQRHSLTEATNYHVRDRHVFGTLAVAGGAALIYTPGLVPYLWRAARMFSSQNALRARNVLQRLVRFFRRRILLEPARSGTTAMSSAEVLLRSAVEGRRHERVMADGLQTPVSGSFADGLVTGLIGFAASGLLYSAISTNFYSDFAWFGDDGSQEQDSSNPSEAVQSDGANSNATRHQSLSASLWHRVKTSRSIRIIITVAVWYLWLQRTRNLVIRR